MNSIDSNNNGSDNGVPATTANAAAAPPPTTPASIPSGKAKASTGFLTRDTDAQLGTDVGRLVTSMTGNPAFPASDPTMAELSAALAAFLAAVSAAHDSKIARTRRVQQRASLVALVRTLAHYVDIASAGDLPTLLSSGFTAQRGHTPVGPLSAPANMRLVRGKFSGQAIARCARVRPAAAYQWRCAAVATPTAWLPVMTTASAHCLFEGLTPGTSYLAQACVVGTAGTSNWSEAATVTVL